MGKSKNKGKKGKQNAVRTIKGKGDYEVSAPSSGGVLAKLDKVLARLPKGTFASGGAMLGGRIGGTRGAELGRRLGAGLSSISGYGDYSVRSNSLSTVSTSVDMVPQFVKNDHSVRVVHREFIKDLVVPGDPTAFTNVDYLINPANANLFPWLARMAKQYSQYKIHGMVFSFKSMSSEYANAGPLGTVVMATNYNAVDRPYINKLEMENSEFAVSTKPSQSLIHAIECDPSVTGLSVLYVRDPVYDTTDTSDRRFYDYGRFQVATTGLQGVAAATLGELWVSYDIEFMKPVIGGDNIANACLALTGQFNGDSAVVPGANPTGVTPYITFVSDTITPAVNNVLGIMGNNATISSGFPLLNGKVVTATSGQIKLLKNGNYTIRYDMVGPTSATAYALSSPTITSTFGTTVDYGTAESGTLGVLGQVPHMTYNITASAGYRCTLVQNVTVRGIADGTGSTNYVLITPPSFTTFSSSLIANLSRSVAIEWAQYGSNGQTIAFSPLPVI